MRIVLLILVILASLSLKAQNRITVYTNDGNKYVGNIIKRDSINKNISLQITGGSVFKIPFGTIDSLKKEYGYFAPVYNRPYFGFGMGVAFNNKAKQFQFDLLAGYQFTPKIQTGIGLCIKEDYSALYLELKYNFYQKSFLTIGAYSQPGIINNSIDYDYYKRSGFYSNSGISFILVGDKSGSFAINTGFQYVNRKETYTDWTGRKVTRIYETNRYIVQGVFTF